MTIFQIYRDNLTEEYIDNFLKELDLEGFFSDNVVFGVGTYPRYSLTENPPQVTPSR